MKTLYAVLGMAALATSASARAQQTIHLQPFNGPAAAAQTNGGQSSAVVTPQASTPPLTSVAIYAVGSTQNNNAYEYTYGKYSTSVDHGGAQLRVVFEEWGYGQNRIAKINGTVLPSSAMYLTQTLCGGTPANPTTCSPGQTVIGFLYYYNLDGTQSGTFQAQSTSINAPIRTYSTSIYIN